jgi:chemotaxis protein CheD
MTPASVVTILGSCVAVGLWDPESGVGGINHYLLPQWSGGADSLKFGDVANALLLDRFGRAGLPASLLRAKIFGGACVVEAFCHRPNALGVRNVEAARHFLAAHAIPVIEEHVLGKCGMRLCFSTADGAAVVRQLGS